MKTKLVCLIVFLVIINVTKNVYSENPTTYRDATTLINDIIGFESIYPISHEEIGRTVNNKPIYVFKIGNPNGGKVLIEATLHGPEYANSEVLYWFIDWLLKDVGSDAVNMRARNYVMIIPIVNIDNYKTTRENAHGVDLNRNFETGWISGAGRGSSALSEPETRAIHEFVERVQPEWFLDLHSGDVRVSPPWGYLSFTPEQSYYQAVYQNYTSICSFPISYVASNNYGNGLARDEGYALGAYSFCVETTSSTPVYSDVYNVILPKVKPLIITVCQECAVYDNVHDNNTTTTADWIKFMSEHVVEISAGTLSTVLLFVIIILKVKPKVKVMGRRR